MAIPAKKAGYTFADILAWPGEEWMELIDGKIDRLRTPGDEHQRVCGELLYQLGTYAKRNSYQVRSAPYAVRLFAKHEDRPEDTDLMVSPDLSVICDPDKIDRHGCKGAPDLVIEILSPSTRGRDRVTKFNLYLKAGVREYWIVNPEDRNVCTFVLDNGRYIAKASEGSGELPVEVLEGCIIDLDAVFPAKRETDNGGD